MISILMLQRLPLCELNKVKFLLRALLRLSRLFFLFFFSKFYFKPLTSGTVCPDILQLLLLLLSSSSISCPVVRSRKCTISSKFTSSGSMEPQSSSENVGKRTHIFLTCCLIRLNPLHAVPRALWGVSPLNPTLQVILGCWQGGRESITVAE